MHRSTDIGQLPIPVQPGLDDAENIQVEQLHRTGPLLPGDPPLWLLLLLRDAPEQRLQPQVPGRDRRGVHRHYQTQTEVASFFVHLIFTRK